jgi:ribosome biogenesis protein ERB1
MIDKKSNKKKPVKEAQPSENEETIVKNVKRKRIPERLPEAIINTSTDQTKDISDDSSDEEMLVRTGDIPRRYYEEYDHAGYNIKSEKVIKPEKKDEVEKFMEKAKNKDWWRNIFDDMNNKPLYLSDKDLEIINRIRKGQFANKNAEDVDYFEKELPYQIHPLNTHLRSKRSFGPSFYEMKKINRIVKAYHEGFIKFDDELTVPQKETIYDIWTGETTNSNGYHPGRGFPAPKRDLPDTIESYNPPEEVMNYLQDEGNALSISQRVDALRKIPKYEKLIPEYFDRCVELVTSARVIHQKTDVKEEDILPKLPKPEELKPFPSRENYSFKGHDASIKCLCIDNTGDYLISGDIGGNVFFWDIATTKIIKKIDLPDKIVSISYNALIKLVVVCCKTNVYFILAPFISRKAAHETRKVLETTIIKTIREKKFRGRENTDRRKTICMENTKSYFSQI